jgi:HEAT repeat protein
VDELREIMLGGDINPAGDAARSLAHIGTDDAVAALIECLEVGRGPAFTLACVGLRKLRSREAVPAIICCLETRSEELRAGQKRILILALGRMPQVSEVPVLAAALTDRRYRTRNAAAWALAQIRAPESRAALETVATEMSWFRALPIRRGLRVRARRADEG